MNDTIDKNKDGSDTGKCCSNCDATLAFWALRGWLAVRAILTGVEKFGAYKTIQKPLIDASTGQPDASGAMSGGNYSVTGGFWALINVVQTPGAPTLYVSHSGNTVTVSWQNVSGWSLIQSGNLATPMGSWSASVGVATGVTNSLTLTNPVGNIFYRLTHP